MNPYHLPPEDESGRPRRYVLHVSGGRTSAYMLYWILDAHGGALPSHVRAVFCNTGKEKPETLVFLRELVARWGVAITWLEYAYDRSQAGGPGAPRNTFREVTFETAARRGEPFEALILSRAFLPNVKMRICTSELKVNTCKRYVRRVLRWKPRQVVDVLGIRHDEPRRWGKALFEECRLAYPLVHAGVSEGDVLDFWQIQPFDLGLQSAEGNCDLCFLKGRRKLVSLIRDDPAAVKWWSDQETQYIERRPKSREPLRKVEMGRFNKRFSYGDLAQAAASMLPLEAPDDDGGGISCFCGD